MARIRPILVLIVAVLVVIVCLAPPANALAPAGGGFFWQSPQPFGSGWYIYNLTFADASHVWGVESGNRLASSDDGGLTWTTVDPGVEGDLYGLTFPDAQHGRLFASWWDTQTKTAQAALVYTDNGGASWATRPMPSRFDTYDAAFATADKGWIVGYGWDKASHKSRPMMLATTDAGQTWQQSVLPVGAPDLLKAIDATHLWMRSGSRSVLVSSDAGATWVRHGLPGGARLNELCPVSATSAWAMVERRVRPYTRVLRTSDSGATWHLATTLDDNAYGTLTATSPDEAWISVSLDFGGGNAPAWVQRTTDGGHTWTRSYVGPRAVGSLAVGPGGVMLGAGAGLCRSTDSGATWLRVVGDGYGYWFDDLCAAGPADLWAVGNTTPNAPGVWGEDGFGILFHCSDGVTWRQQDLPLGALLQAVDFADAQNGWAVGGSGRVLRTTDGGASWSSRPADSRFDLSDVKALSAQSAVALGYDGSKNHWSIVSTKDGGATWQAVVRPSRELLRTICVLSPSHMLVAGELMGKNQTGMLLETTDGGATWTRRLLTVKPWVQDMTFIDATHGWILASDSQSMGLASSSGHGTVVLRTSDGGATWQSADLGKVSDAGLTSLAFSDADHGWAVGDMVLKTSDGGASWQDAGVDVPGSPTMREVPMLRAVVCSDEDVWAVGPSQVVLSTLDTAADTAPPVTIDDGDRLWHNSSVTVHLSAFDAASGVARTEYHIAGLPGWTTGDEVTFEAPIDHSGDGRHEFTYRSIDVAGNVEFAESCVVLIDTTTPEPLAKVPHVAAQGSTAVLGVRVNDDPSPDAQVTLKLVRWTGSTMEVVQTKHVGLLTTNEWHNVTVRYTAPKGSYYWVVEASDLAGNAADEELLTSARVTVT